MEPCYAFFLRSKTALTRAKALHTPAAIGLCNTETACARSFVQFRKHACCGCAYTLTSCASLQFYLNDGEPVAMSIPASEHSVMTAWRTEREAMENMIEHFGSGILACVMDSYDYVQVSHPRSDIVSCGVPDASGRLLRSLNRYRLCTMHRCYTPDSSCAFATTLTVLSLFAAST